MPRKPRAKDRQHRADLKWRRLRQWLKGRVDYFAHHRTVAATFELVLSQMDMENRRARRKLKG